jgi:hypothetical protein
MLVMSRVNFFIPVNDILIALNVVLGAHIVKYNVFNIKNLLNWIIDIIP